MGEKRDEQIAQAKEIIFANTPKEMHAHLTKMTGEQAAVLAIAINNIAKNHIAPDKLPIGGGNETGGTSAEAVRAQAREIMKNPAYNDEGHPDNAKLRKQVSDMYQSINKKL